MVEFVEKARKEMSGMRKLFHIAAGYCAALILAHYYLPLHILPYVSAAALVISIAAFFFKNDLRARVFLLVIPFAIGLFWTWAHNELFVREAVHLSDRECTASAVVLGYPKTGDYYSSVLVRLTDEDMPRTKVRISSYDYDL